MTTRCLCLSLSAHSTGVLSDVDLMVPMMGVSADSREDPAPRRGFRRPGRGAGGWGPGIAHVALGRRVKARASSPAGRAVYPPGKDLSSRAQPGIRRSLERGGKGPRIRLTGYRGAQERAPFLGFRPGPTLRPAGHSRVLQVRCREPAGSRGQANRSGSPGPGLKRFCRWPESLQEVTGRTVRSPRTRLTPP